MNHDVNDLIKVSIVIYVDGVATDGGKLTPYTEELADCFGASEDDFVVYLTELLDAARTGKIYGFMQAAMINARIRAGDLRKEDYYGEAESLAAAEASR